MATLRTIASPPELAQAPSKVLSADGRTVACRVEGDKPGLYAFDVGGLGRPLKLDQPGQRYHSPAWSAWGDLLFRVDRPSGPGVGVVPAFGRGGAVEFSGTGVAVSGDGRVLAVANPGAGALEVAVAASAGNSPFAQTPKKIADLKEHDPAAPMALDVTRDGAYVVAVRCAQERSPSLWSFPSAGGDPQELVPQVAAPAALAFALGKAQLAVLEVRAGASSTSRLYVRPMSPGSLGLMRLGPARDLFFTRAALPAQRPAFSPDGKKIAFIGFASTPTGDEMSLELLPTTGGKAVRAAQALDLRGNARFLESGEVVVDGLDRVSVVTL